MSWGKLRALSFACAAGGIVVSLPCAAQTDNPSPIAAPVAQSYSLGEVLTLTRRQYPAIKAALAERTVAERQVKVEKTAYLPQITLLAQINRSTVNNVTGLLLPQAVLPSISGPVLPASGRTSWNGGAGVTASWSPFDFGFRSAKVSAARSGADVAGESERLTELDVMAAATDAYLNLVAADALADSAQANLDRVQSFANAVHVLVDNKLHAGVDAEQANSSVALARTTLIEAQTSAEAQRAILGRLLGLPADRVLVEHAFIEALPPTPTASDVALDHHPAMRRAGAVLDQRDAELRAIKRSIAPQIDLIGSAFARGSSRDAIGGYRDNGSGLVPDVGNWAVGMQVSVPLGNIPKARAEASVQRARIDAARAERDLAKAELVERITRARTDLSAARQIAAIMPSAIQAARTGKSQQRVRFQHGLATVVEVAAAQATLIQAESQNAIARINVWRATLTLALAQGDVAVIEDLLKSRG